MVKHEFTFPSADSKTNIHAVSWLPDGTPVAVLQIAHGISEYVLRYEPFAQYLTEQGFAVVGNDHIGHGLSGCGGCALVLFRPAGQLELCGGRSGTAPQTDPQPISRPPLFPAGTFHGVIFGPDLSHSLPRTVNGAVIMEPAI